MRQFSLIFMVLIAGFALYQSFSMRSAAPVDDDLLDGRKTVGERQSAIVDDDRAQSQPLVGEEPMRPAEQPSATEVSKPKQEVQDSRLQFKQVDYFERDTTGIDYKFMTGGAAFDVDLDILKNLKAGDQIALDFSPIHFVLRGEVADVLHTANKQIAIRIDFVEDGTESAINMHFDADGNMEAKMYTSTGNFELIHNKHVGFIISFEEMENLERLELER